MTAASAISVHWCLGGVVLSLAWLSMLLNTVAFLALIEREDIRQEAPGELFDLR